MRSKLSSKMKEEKKKIQNNFIVAAGLLALFILYTVAIMFVDVQPIGPQGSSVGFAEVNQYFHTLFGVNMLLYSITDWLSIAVLFIMFGFAIKITTLIIVNIIDKIVFVFIQIMLE